MYASEPMIGVPFSLGPARADKTCFTLMSWTWAYGTVLPYLHIEGFAAASSVLEVCGHAGIHVWVHERARVGCFPLDSMNQDVDRRCASWPHCTSLSYVVGKSRA